MYVYAFVQALHPEMPLPMGIAGPLSLIGEAGLWAVVEPDLDVEPLQNHDQQLLVAVLHHDAVLCEIFSQTNVLPLRFGTQFVSQDALWEHLRSHSTAYLETLDRLAHKAEYALKLTPCPLNEAPKASPIDPTSSGRDYFKAKKQQFQTVAEQEALQRAELNNFIATIAAQYLMVHTSSPGEEKVYLLADRSLDLAIVAPLWQKQCPAWRLSLSPALPPYHFV